MTPPPITRGDRVVLNDDSRVLRVETLPRYAGGNYLLRESRGKNIVATVEASRLDWDARAGLWRERE